MDLTDLYLYGHLNFLEGNYSKSIEYYKEIQEKKNENNTNLLLKNCYSKIKLNYSNNNINNKLKIQANLDNKIGNYHKRPFFNKNLFKIEKLNQISENLENNKENSDLFFEKSKILFLMGKTKSSFQNSHQSAYLDQYNKDKIIELIKISLFSNNDTFSLSLLNNNFYNTNFSINIYKSIYLWKQKQYFEAISNLKNSILINDIEALKLRAQFYYLMGNINESYNDYILIEKTPKFIIFLLKILLELPLPQILITSEWQSIILSNFKINLIKSLHNSIIKIPIDFWINRNIQQFWTSEGLLNFNFYDFSNIKEFDYPEGFPLGLNENQRKNSNILYNFALKISNEIFYNHFNKRYQICLGMSIIELIFLYQNNNLSLSNSISIILNWLRLIDPLQHYFRRDLNPNHQIILFFQKNEILTELNIYSSRILNFIKKKIINNFNKNLINNINNIDQLYSLLHSDLCLNYDYSNIEIFIQKPCGLLVNYGIIIPNSINHWKITLPPVYLSYSRVLTFLKQNNIKESLINLYHFLFLWMRAYPITSNSHIIGLILFNSLFYLITSKFFPFNSINPLHILMESLLAENFEEFINFLKKNSNSNLILFSFNELPNPSIELPNLLIRIQSLLFI